MFFPPSHAEISMKEGRLHFKHPTHICILKKHFNCFIARDKKGYQHNIFLIFPQKQIEKLFLAEKSTLSGAMVFLHISIFIRLSVECRESNCDILMSSQRSLHRKTVRNKHQKVLYCGLVDCTILIIFI